MRVKWMRPGGAAALALAVIVSGCSQPLSTREKSTLAGGGIGAATGAIIGAAVGNPGAGAAIGGALGAGTGVLVGDQLQKHDVQEAEQRHELGQQEREIERQRAELKRLERQRSGEADEY
jgi:uncharacterized protein YcfJ